MVYCTVFVYFVCKHTGSRTAILCFLGETKYSSKSRKQKNKAVLDIANPIDPIDRSIRILNQVVAMERDEALRRPRWCGRSKSRDLL